MKKLFAIICAMTLLGVTPFTLALRAADSGTKSKKTEAHPKRTAKVDVNTADAETLQTLPGVGPVTASAIIAARPFKSVDDLERVPGIGPAKLADLRTHVTVSRTTQPKKAGATPKASGSARTGKSTEADREAATASDQRELEPTGRAGAARTKSASPAATAGKVNINTATLEELEALPEIGPVKARAIIDARPFSSPQDIKRVKGIKEGTYEEIKDRITVGR